jgi:hypothetical protein
MTKGKFWFGFFLFVFVVSGIFALYTWATLSYTYSNGKRAGFLQKFSQRGWVCKTWEGEIVTGSMIGNQEKFLFSVRDDALAKQMGDAIGKRVEIDYDQHIGIPTNCFGETEYFAKSLKLMTDGMIKLPE